MEKQEQEYGVPENGKGKRIDVMLMEYMEGYSRSQIQKMIEEQLILVNHKPVKANQKVQVGDLIQIRYLQPKPLELIPEKIPLDVVYEDESVIVINKARGMVVHPAAGNYTGTLVNALLSYCDDLSGINGISRPGIVHRLDKDTSGVMVVAKSDKAHASLAKQIKERSASRRYLAIVHGNVKEDKGIIKAPIGRHPVDRKKMAVVFENSKEAITRFHVLERFGEYTLVECKLLTGRTHQIRVHMAYIGHPVVGDTKYGPERSHFSILGQALHSAELTFQHPITHQTMQFSKDIPDDMKVILNELRNQLKK